MLPGGRGATPYSLTSTVTVSALSEPRRPPACGSRRTDPGRAGPPGQLLPARDSAPAAAATQWRHVAVTVQRLRVHRRVATRARRGPAAARRPPERQARAAPAPPALSLAPPTPAPPRPAPTPGGRRRHPAGRRGGPRWHGGGARALITEAQRPPPAPSEFKFQGGSSRSQCQVTVRRGAARGRVPSHEPPAQTHRQPAVATVITRDSDGPCESGSRLQAAPAGPQAGSGDRDYPKRFL